MIVTCRACDVSYNLDDSLLKQTGSKVRCSKCGNVFVAHPPRVGTEAYGPAGGMPSAQREEADLGSAVDQDSRQGDAGPEIGEEDAGPRGGPDTEAEIPPSEEIGFYVGIDMDEDAEAEAAWAEPGQGMDLEDIGELEPDAGAAREAGEAAAVAQADISDPDESELGVVLEPEQSMEQVSAGDEDHPGDRMGLDLEDTRELELDEAEEELEAELELEEGDLGDSEGAELELELEPDPETNEGYREEQLGLEPEDVRELELGGAAEELELEAEPALEAEDGSELGDLVLELDIERPVGEAGGDQETAGQDIEDTGELAWEEAEAEPEVGEELPLEAEDADDLGDLDLDLDMEGAPEPVEDIEEDEPGLGFEDIGEPELADADQEPELVEDLSLGAEDAGDLGDLDLGLDMGEAPEPVDDPLEEEAGLDLEDLGELELESMEQDPGVKEEASLEPEDVGDFGDLDLDLGAGEAPEPAEDRQEQQDALGLEDIGGLDLEGDGGDADLGAEPSLEAEDVGDLGDLDLDLDVAPEAEDEPQEEELGLDLEDVGDLELGIGEDEPEPAPELELEGTDAGDLGDLELDLDTGGGSEPAQDTQEEESGLGLEDIGDLELESDGDEPELELEPELEAADAEDLGDLGLETETDEAAEASEEWQGDEPDLDLGDLGELELEGTEEEAELEIEPELEAEEAEELGELELEMDAEQALEASEDGQEDEPELDLEEAYDAELVDDEEEAELEAEPDWEAEDIGEGEGLDLDLDLEATGDSGTLDIDEMLKDELSEADEEGDEADEAFDIDLDMEEGGVSVDEALSDPSAIELYEVDENEMPFSMGVGPDEAEGVEGADALVGEEAGEDGDTTERIQRYRTSIFAVLLVVMAIGTGYACYSWLTLMDIRVPGLTAFLEPEDIDGDGRIGMSDRLPFLTSVTVSEDGEQGTKLKVRRRIPFLSSLMEPADIDAGGILEIRTFGITSRFIDNNRSGKMFVITGQVRNEYDEPRRFIQVTGKIYKRGDVPVGTQTVFCGNSLSDAELANSDLKVIKERLAYRPGDKRSNMMVLPGRELPFMVVFHNLPESLDVLDKFRVTVAGSEKA